tara:strand:+ start:107 stop:304 length:198 start_codon:yes stop_codon:yes gene_type:complete
MANKRKPDKYRAPENVVLTVAFKRSELEEFSEACEEDDVTRSQVIRKLVRKYLADRRAGNNPFII